MLSVNTHRSQPILLQGIDLKLKGLEIFKSKMKKEKMNILMKFCPI